MANSLTADEAMAAVFAEFGLPEIEPDEFTGRMYAELHGLPPQTAINHLNRALKAGRVTRRKVVVNGGKAWSYRWCAES